MFRVKRIKHVTVMVPDRDRATARYRDVFNFGEAHPGQMPGFGLINDHFPVGGSFVEVLEVVDHEKPGGRFLRRFGPGFYMLIFEIEDQPAAVAHLEQMGARLTLKGAADVPEYRNIHIHPESNLGPLLGLGDPYGSNPWKPGGPHWQRERRDDVVEMFREAAIVTPKLDSMIERYRSFFGFEPARVEPLPGGGRAAWMPIGETVLQLVEPGPGTAAAAHLERRGPGLYEVRVRVHDLESAIERAANAGVQSKPIGAGPERAALLDPEAMFGARWVLVQREGEWPAEGIDLEAE